MNELEDILNYLETTSLEPHDDYVSEFSYKDQKTLWKYIKELQQENQKLKKQLEERPKEYVFIGNAQNKTRDFINQIIKENREHKEAIDRAIEYLESKRIREKAIIDIDVLEGILKEVDKEVE